MRLLQSSFCVGLPHPVLKSFSPNPYSNDTILNGDFAGRGGRMREHVGWGTLRRRPESDRNHFC